jgi:anti-sigma factor RsiW
MSDHADLQRSLGAYVLGALEPAERGELDAHLTGCAACREELASYAGLPALLSRVSLQEATDGPGLPPPTLLPRVLSAVERERDRGARRLRLWQAATAAVTAAAAVAAVAVLLMVGPGPTGRAATARPLVALQGVSATGQLTLESRPWGTAVHLRLHHLPPAASYTAWAVDDAGTRSAIATWGPTGDGSAEVTGATALPPAGLRSLTISTGDGQPLFRLDA